MCIYKLQNTVQNYAWGSQHFIPDLMNFTKTGNPQAEVWMGAHPKAPSFVTTQKKSLLELIKNNSKQFLGDCISKKYKRNLPFLLKVLSASKPLSIQAHPNLEQARKGFNNESKKAIPLTAFTRNYKDDNHKPELIYALTPFTAMCGFRPFHETQKLLNEFGMRKIIPDYMHIDKDTENFKQFFSDLMNATPDNVGKWTDLLLDNLKRVNITPANNLIIEWIFKLNDFFPHDIGLFSPILLNLFILEPGQSIYLEAGILHAYLHGSGIEIMANSDNVLRGGLTPKHIDVKELLNILTFQAKPVCLIEPVQKGCEQIFNTPALEFELSCLELADQYTCDLSVQGPEIILCIKGKCQLHYSTSSLNITKGDSFFISDQCNKYHLSGNAILFRAKVPSNEMGSIPQ